MGRKPPSTDTEFWRQLLASYESLSAGSRASPEKGKDTLRDSECKEFSEYMAIA